MTISLNQILPIENQQEYEVHLASKDEEAEPKQPLDAFVQDRKKWESWSSQCSSKNDFNRKYVFLMMGFYHEKDTWLFGGIYEVLPSGSGKPGEGGYKLKLIEHASELIGRLKISFERSYFEHPHNKLLLLENYYEKMTVSEILKKQYSGRKIFGYENTDEFFESYEFIILLIFASWVLFL